jgi:hypothetical protein
MFFNLFVRSDGVKNFLLIFSLILMVFALVGKAYAVDVPMYGTFGIEGTAPSPVNFNPAPWVSPDLLNVVNVYPFAASGLYNSSTDNLAWAKFSNGTIVFKTDYGVKTGDLGVRFSNNTTGVQTFIGSVLTLKFTDRTLNVYLPEFTFDSGDNFCFWVSTTGATYYANSSKGPGFSNMIAADAMAAGDLYFAAAPEPATVIILGLGTVFLVRIRR